MNVSRYVCALGLTMTTALSGVAAPTAASPSSSKATQTALTPPNATASASTFDAAIQRDIIAKLSEALRDRYVFPEVAERAAARISAALAAGEYDGLGELRSVKFRRSMMGGGEFVLRFANGSRLMPIVLDQDGKIVAALPPIPASATE